MDELPAEETSWALEQPFFLTATKPFHLEKDLPRERVNELKAHGVLWGEWKNVNYPAWLPEARELLFHLGEDPAEERNRVAQRPELVAFLRGLVVQYWSTPAGSDVVTREVVDSETRRRLRSLGYLQ